MAEYHSLNGLFPPVLPSKRKHKPESSKRPLPGDVVIHSIASLLVMDPVADENAGGLLCQLPRAQHAVTVPLPAAETALIHLAAGVPDRISTPWWPRLHQKPWWWAEYSGPSLSVELQLNKMLHPLVFAITVDLPISPVSVVTVGLVQLFVGYYTLPVTGKETTKQHFTPHVLIKALHMCR